MPVTSHKTIDSFKERTKRCTHPVSVKLFSLMEEKQTNLCVAADVTRGADLLALAKEIGSEICVLKTHIDILEDFTPTITKELSVIAKDLGFLIFEDRKFADIGSTVRMQFEGGLYKISSWAHLINAHILPGPGVIQGLKNSNTSENFALLLIAQMSSKGHLMNEEYSKQAVRLALEYSDSVIGFITQTRLTSQPHLLHFTPGVQLHEGGDSLQQSYRSPKQAIEEQGNDIIIVGRGILNASDHWTTANRYKKIGWGNYLKNLR